MRVRPSRRGEGQNNGISKRGNRYLRRLLINGASADPWVIGAPSGGRAWWWRWLANKTARPSPGRRCTGRRTTSAWPRRLRPPSHALELAREQCRVMVQSSIRRNRDKPGAAYWDINPVRMMRIRFADPIRASSPSRTIRIAYLPLAAKKTDLDQSAKSNTQK
jgi:hypothetical protein